MKKRSQEISQQELTQTRYPGSEVCGMEYTNALPIGKNGRAPETLPQPNQTAKGDSWRGRFCYDSTTDGRKGGR